MGLHYRRRQKIGPGLWRNFSWSPKRGMTTSTTIRSGDVTVTKGPRIGGRQRVNTGNGWFAIRRLWRPAHAVREARAGGKRIGVLGWLVLIVAAILSV